MKSKITSLILFASIISVTQFCSAKQTKYAPIIQAQKSTLFGPVIEKKQETRDSTTFGKPNRRGTLVSGSGGQSNTSK